MTSAMHAIRLQSALMQRTEASAAVIDAAETPGAQLAAWTGYQRSLSKVAEQVDPEAARASTKRAVAAVQASAMELRALIEHRISELQPDETDQDSSREEEGPCTDAAGTSGAA